MAPGDGRIEVEIRRARRADVPGILDVQRASYPVLALVSEWRREHLEAHQRTFPDGQLVGALGSRIVGHSASFITTSRRAFAPHTFREITANGTFDSHDATGDTLYGAEIMVHPDFRRRGVGGRFYEARFGIARRLGLRYFAAGGRLPGYERHAGEMSAEEYARRVARGDLSDRVLLPQLRSGLQLRGILPGYLHDPRSLGYASLLVWENPDLVAQRPGRTGTPGAKRRTAP